MSAGSVVANRYAKALYETAAKQGIVADVEQQLSGLAAAIVQNADVKAFLGSPNVASDRKLAVIKEALAGKLSDVVLSTVGLLIERGRHGEIAGVYEAYKKIAGAATGQASATVYTAKPLGDEELAKVAEQFGKVAGKAIRAEQVVDPKLLGGIQVRIGDRLYDGSLSGKLARLEKSLKS